ncbi:5'-methylthioadenosine/S-adenosylhomocysteine nucleosidase family protein [Streptomyces abikoensis]|uniref:5'-methylthioadenosine/S-adenosylhomocysteine nucleosidase family protein n=1 Tax=Streptomyces abikoensis TaxID=97398 RepID=UPI00167A0C37|nr:nucleosidase [Streptomyces abikoensis]GGP36738.1 nucleosidase [Streptomyces abikoensis]
MRTERVGDPWGVVAVLTALPAEYRAVRGRLEDVQRLPFSWGRGAECGRLPGSPWRVVLGLVGEGNQAATSLTELVGELEPEVVFFVGVASCLEEDIALGDVVVATTAYDFQAAALKQDGTGARSRSWDPPGPLLQGARAALRDGLWRRRIPSDDVRPVSPLAGVPVVHFEPLACGGVSSSPVPGELVERLRHNCGDAVAVESGSSGFAAAAYPRRPGHALVVCGIDARVDAVERAVDAVGARSRAAAHAAAVVTTVIADLRPSRSGDRGVQPSAAPPQDRPPGRIPTERHYGGDHIEFSGSFANSVTGKYVDRRRGPFHSGNGPAYTDGGQSH